MIQMNLFIKQKHIYILREWIYGYLGAGGKGEGTDESLELICTHCYIFFLKPNSPYTHLLEQVQNKILV